jgi:ribosomal protein S18 acetylase RimI-like enzyme
MSVSLKIADENDAKLLSELGAITFSEAFGEFYNQQDLKNYLQDAFDEGAIKKELLDGDYTFILAFDENKNPLGYAKLNWSELPKHISNSEAVHLQRIYVRGNMKGKKVGAHLMEKCIEVAKQKNRNIIWLGVWQENKIAIDFYKQWGFETFGYKQFMIGDSIDDDFMMKKVLK